MTQEEKQLLLKDLCARLHCGVKVSIIAHNLDYERDFEKIIIAELVGIHTAKEDDGTTHTCFITCYDEFKTQGNDINTIKPYLRPMSSMSRNESFELGEIMLDLGSSNVMTNIIDFYNAHHLDHRGLIEKGLAIEAPEGMYKAE